MNAATLSTDISLAPALPLWAIGTLVLLGVLVTLPRLGRAPGGTILRLVTIGIIALALLGPERRETEGTLQPDIALLLEDESRSLEFGGRAQITQSATDRLEAALEAEGLEVRRGRFGDRRSTALGDALEQSLGDIPRRRLSAVFALTDGQVHGTGGATVAGLGAPLHTVLTGRPGQEVDRRVDVVRAPRFGVVGETVEITLTVLSPTEAGQTVPTQLIVGGEPYAEQNLPIGEPVTLSVRLRQPGDTIVELVASTAPGELTALNNRGVVALTAVRDRLRVLLVSGEPHAGERVWRNILKSDPAVDLVHFTILKPANKPMTARREELNLIEFPHEQLFLEKLNSFDVVIFDRYTYRGVLQAYEFDQIARYVERGGALLVAAGPEFAERGGLASQRNLNYILPVLPRGEANSAAFVPARSDIGARHPVTAELADPTDWGRWLRYLPAVTRKGDVLLTATNDAPLLIVDRVQEGRIGVLLSDHAWLWARGFDGGGPHQELLRRLVHWLMQEPELEEESLSGAIDEDGSLAITRRTLAPQIAPITITDPDGQVTTAPLRPRGPGLFVAEVPAPLPGLYRLETKTSTDETLYALAASDEGPLAELSAVVTTDAA